MLTQFLSSEQLFKQKLLDVGTRIAGVEKYDGGNLCPLWLNQFVIVSETLVLRKAVLMFHFRRQS